MTALILEPLQSSFHFTNSQYFFAQFAHQPWAMLLHSGESQHSNTQFDIIVASPVATIVSKDKRSTITSCDQQIESTEDPLQLLHNLVQEHLPINKNPSTLPFIGGAVGSFHYELGTYFEQLPQTQHHELDLPEMMVGIYQWAIIVDHQQKHCWFVSQGPTQQQALLPLLDPKIEAEKFCLRSPWQQNMSYAQYTEKFNRIQEYLFAGDCYQINLTQQFSAQFQGDPYQAFQYLQQANQSPFSAYLSFPDHQVLSLSPERFVELRQGKVQAKPIKGTISRADDWQQDQQRQETLQHSTKDRAENVMIVDLLRNDLSRVSQPGSVTVEQLFAVESFAAVHHLVSTISSQLLPQYQAIDLIRACFPGGSITGAPKIRAMQIITELEPHQRTVYCGSIGYLCASGDMDLNIAIRSLICHQQQIFCWAGGGIVVDSSVESEYAECFAKVNKILPILEKMSHE